MTKKQIISTAAIFILALFSAVYFGQPVDQSNTGNTMPIVMQAPTEHAQRQPNLSAAKIPVSLQPLSLTEKAASLMKAQSTANAVQPSQIDKKILAKHLAKLKYYPWGEVVVDKTGKLQLSRAFAALDAPLPIPDQQQLKEAILKAVPGDAGEQLATIVLDFHDYHIAVQEYRQYVDELEVQADANSIADSSLQLEHIVALRNSYLGHDVADKMFGSGQAYARNYLAAMEISADKNLTDEERDRQLKSLQDELDNRLNP